MDALVIIRSCTAGLLGKICTYINHNIYIYILVGGFNHLEKYEFVNRKVFLPYIKWKIKKTCSKPPNREIYLH